MTDPLAPGAERPTWLAPSLRLASWVVALSHEHERAVRRDVANARALPAARSLLHRQGPHRVISGMVVGQVVAPPSEAEAEHAAETAWDRIQAGGERALDGARREAVRLYEATQRLHDRWAETRATEAAVLDELRRGIGELAMTAASAPGATSRALSGGGALLLLALLGFAFMSSRGSDS
jgi:hypothetical protein